MLQRGDRGDAVAALQDQLIRLGLMSEAQKATGPGVFGPTTERCLKRAQMYVGLDPSGIYDSASQAAIEAAEPIPAGEITNAVVDLSHHQENVDFQALHAGGFVGVIYKATQRTTYRDPTYAQRRRQVKAAGLLWGAYHFGEDGDGADQARHFLDVAQPDAQTLLVLDYEPYQNQTMTLDQARQFVSTVHAETGRYPGLYSGHLIKETLGDDLDPLLAKCWFWLAQYGDTAVVPINWPTWTMWQYTDGSLGPEPHEAPGIGPCDRDKFNGSLEQLRAFWLAGGQAVSACAPVTT